ncbi:MAG: hypothetical protein ACYCSN_00005 [Acidobacteriaceae bacterium]
MQDSKKLTESDQKMRGIWRGAVLTLAIAAISAWATGSPSVLAQAAGQSDTQGGAVQSNGKKNSGTQGIGTQSSTSIDDSDRKLLQAQVGEEGIRRSRLYLKDGSYQIVARYVVAGDRVRYLSAERGDVWEEVPVSLVDWDATHKWEKDHAPGAALQTTRPAVPIDPELLRDEQEQAARMPEVQPNLFLPEDGGVLALDAFRGTPELAVLKQSQSQAGATSSHNILKAAINPMSLPHPLLQLPGIQARTQIHVNLPVLYISLDSDSLPDAEPRDFRVDTHGASSLKDAQGGSSASRYVIVRADVRRDIRVIGSFDLVRLGDGSQSEILVETQAEAMPGGKWMKLTPKEPLSFGEYALMEVLSPREVNLGVWDFGVHPAAPENRDVIVPLAKKKLTVVER